MESTFQVAVYECPDINASTLAVDITGRYALVSGRKSMVLMDLDGSRAESCQTNSSPTYVSGTQDSQQLQSPTKSVIVPKRMVRNSKYEPTSCQFSRNLADLFALTTYQVIDVFSIEDLNPNKPKLSLRGHSRAISDLEWSHFDAYLVGSSAADCLTNLWDIRDGRRPIASLTSVSGATQVRFCKTSSNLLATSHDIDVRIWDIRQPNLPLYYIAAHLQKINGMDWCPNKTTCDHEQLITCSQDNTIKLWDLNANKIRPSANLATRTPAWRIRYTPVSSSAILTSTWPQLRSRNECTSLKLWSLKPDRCDQKKLELLLNLVSHTDIIVDFDWRPRPSSTGCEIVSWAKDQTLRIWRIDNQFIEMNVENSDYEADCDTQCDQLGSESVNNSNPFSNDKPLAKTASDIKGQNATVSTPNLSPVIESGAEKQTLSPKSVSRLASPMSTGGKSTDQEHESDLDDVVLVKSSSSINELRQEFNLLNKNIPNIEFEELNALRRVCLVTASAKTIACRLRIALPPAYPHDECPTFTIIDSNQYAGEALDKEVKEKLLRLLNETARSQLSRNRNCLEPCLRKFIAALQKITSHGSYRKRSTSSGADTKDDPITLSAQRDHSVPFPPTCRARFCGNLLICFGRPIIPTLGGSESASGEGANWLVETPRSMAQLSAQLDNMRRQGSYNLSHISISYFYYGAMRRAELQSRGLKGLVGGRANSKYLAGRNKAPLHANQSSMFKGYKCGPVLVYDVSDLLGGICRELAEDYVFDKDVIKMCRLNAKVAALHNRHDLVQIWSLAELSSEGVLNSFIPNKNDRYGFTLVNDDSDFGDRPWTMHPFGSKLIQSLINHYVYNCRDVQTAAMLVWTFSSTKLGKSRRLDSNSKYIHSTSELSNSYTKSDYQQPYGASLTERANNVDPILDEWNLVGGPEAHLYSNSWSNSTIHEHSNEPSTEANKSSRTTVLNQDGSGNVGGDDGTNHLPKLNILSPERNLQNDLIMHIYAEVLYRLNLLNQRAMVLKNVGCNSAYSELFVSRQESQDKPEDRLSNLVIQCYNSDCRGNCKSVQCSKCKRYSLYCSICRLPVKGSCSVCLKCHHGGHINHFRAWFESYDFCPTGCGCKCLSAEC